MASSAEIATRNREVQRQNAPRTEYTLRLKPDQYETTDEKPSLKRRITINTKTSNTQHRTPSFMPSFLGNERVIVYSWAISMAVIAWDEWKRHNIFPRPQRLWWATLFYGMLAIAGMADPLTPLINALAVGYTIMLLWQYYNASGQFAGGTKA